MRLLVPELSLLLSTTILTAAASSPLAPRQSGTTTVANRTPWELSNIAVFDATAVSAPVSLSYIRFDFRDTNVGIELRTTCARTVAADGSLAGAENYHDCEGDGDVSFMYLGESMEVKRTWTDDSVGPPPMNRVTGWATANFSMATLELPVGLGTLRTQEYLETYVDRMIA
ncbi:hypothetical protein BDY21DRAFT_374177 [Lineolata rhizophorae]|uniref:AA1-like domain-containing protein n=1 Tax=Lineolata rhizophorae TaxID=578093 RepID=A0A6A6NR91_9PEZI|nr:hypothetical protein BDY21DRAFT_374177 [Lineolata rhizophorae]